MHFRLSDTAGMAANAESPVIVFGSGRSGTTWVQDALAEANDYATVFEPLHPDAVPGAARYANRYVRPGTRDPELSAFMRSALEGSLAPVWTGLRTRPDRLRPSLATLSSIEGLRNLRASYTKFVRAWLARAPRSGRPKIVKFIRANLLADWLVAEFDVRGVVIVRHPCAVLSSVLHRKGNEWEQAAVARLLARYLDQHELVEDRLRERLPELRRLRRFAEQHTAIWCIENADFLRHDSSGLPVVHYERLIAEPDTEWQRVARSLDLAAIPDRDIRDRPSQQASYKALREASSERYLAGWQATLATDQLEQVARVLQLFEVRAYDTQDAMPVAARGAVQPSRPAGAAEEDR